MSTQPTPVAREEAGRRLDRDGGDVPSRAPIKPSLMLKRRLRTSPAKVYAAWTDPAKILRWFGPEHCETFHAETDVRVGGAFRMIMREQNGEQHDVSGVYREVVPNEKLVFTWAWRTTPERESLVTIELRPDGEETIITLSHEQFFDETARDGHKDGWSQSLDRLERFFS